MLDNTEFLDVMLSCVDRRAVFRKHGFILEKISAREPRNGLDAGWTVLFDAEAFRRIEFSIIPISDCDALTGIIIRDMMTNKLFTVDDWLAFRGNRAVQPLMRLRNQPGDSLDQKLRHYCDFVDGVLSNSELDDILRGKLWLDVPFDCEWFN